MEKKWLWVLNEKNNSKSRALGSKSKRNDSRSLMKIDSRLRALGSKWKRNDSGSEMKKRLLVERSEVWALNGKKMTLGYTWKLTLGRELSALKGKEITLGYKWKSTLGREL